MVFSINYVYKVLKNNQRMLYNVSKELRKIKITNIILYLEEIEFVKMFLTGSSANNTRISSYKTELKKDAG